MYMGLPLSENNLKDVQRFQMLNSTLYVKPTTIPKIKVIDNIKPLEIIKRQREQLGEQIQKLVGREKKVLDTLRANFPNVQVDHKYPQGLLTGVRADVQVGSVSVEVKQEKSS